MLKNIRQQILLLAGVPLIGLIVFCGILITDNYSRWSDARVLEPLTTLASKAEWIIHDLQKERGLSVGLVSSGYDSAAAEKVAAQRETVDQRIAEFITALGATQVADPEMNKEFRHTADELSKVAELRSSLDAKSAKVPDVVGGYTGLIKQAVHVIALTVETSTDPRVTAELAPFLVLVEAKEAGGLERAIGAALLNIAATGEVPFERYLAYTEMFAAEKAYLSEFQTLALKDQRALYKQTVQGPVVDQVAEWRKVLRALPQTKDGQGIRGEDWFATATKRLDLIKSVSDGIVARAQSAAAATTSSLRNTLVLLGSAALFAITATLALAFMQMRAVTGALKSITGTISSLSEGQTDIEVPMTDRKDDIGNIARAALVFRDNLIENAEAREREAAAERKKKEENERIVTMTNEFARKAAAIVESVSSAATELEATAAGLNEAVDDSKQKVEGAAGSSENASSNVSTVASSAEELSSSIEEINRQVSQATTAVEDVNENARQSNERINSLAESVNKIGEVVTLIQDIAEQTNLLALNATIEAARAGEMGKGFAVVASEVKSLANQTAKATEDIAAQISEVQGSTSTAVDSISSITNAISDVQTITSAIAAAVEEQGAATGEISRSAVAAASDTRSVVDNMTGVAATADSTKTSADNVHTASEELSRQASMLKQEVDSFLKNLAA